MERERDILTSVFFVGVRLGFLIAQLCFGPQEVCDFNGLLFFAVQHCKGLAFVGNISPRFLGSRNCFAQ